MNTPRFIALALVLAGGLAFAPAQAAARPSETSNSQVFELPAAAGAGDGKEVTVLMDESFLKLATIALRGGTPLPAHSAAVPATILLLQAGRHEGKRKVVLAAYHDRLDQRRSDQILRYPVE